MQRQKPTKLEPKHFKNTLIRSRMDGESTKPALNGSNEGEGLSITPKFLESLSPNEPSSRREGAYVSSPSVESNSSTRKRLKLKDYIHLNGL